MRISEYRAICKRYGFSADISLFANPPQHLFVKYLSHPNPVMGEANLFAHSFKEIDRMEPRELEERLLQISLEATFPK